MQKVKLIFIIKIVIWPSFMLFTLFTLFTQKVKLIFIKFNCNLTFFYAKCWELELTFCKERERERKRKIEM
jgi:hypothetical protein